MQSVTLRSIARTSRGSTTMAISPARLRSDSSIRVRCGDGRSLRAGLSAAISACRAGARDPGLDSGTAQGVRDSG